MRAKMVTCANCKAEVRREAAFCPRCGQAVGPTCHACGQGVAKEKTARTYRGRLYCRACVRALGGRSRFRWFAWSVGGVAGSLILLLSGWLEKSNSDRRYAERERQEAERGRQEAQRDRQDGERLRQEAETSRGYWEAYGRDLWRKYEALRQQHNALAQRVTAQPPAAAGADDRKETEPWKSRKNWEALRPGMSEQQVVAILGQPASKHVSDPILPTDQPITYLSYDTTSYQHAKYRVLLHGDPGLSGSRSPESSFGFVP